jgi:hypothetical protein
MWPNAMGCRLVRQIEYPDTAPEFAEVKIAVVIRQSRSMVATRPALTERAGARPLRPFV